MSPLRIALISSEVAPFAKTGGLADVAAGLADHLVQAGHDVRVFMPLYGQVIEKGHELEDLDEVGDVSLQFDGTMQTFRMRKARIPGTEAEVWFVDCPEMFGREEIYSSTYADEHIRFGLLCRAVLETCQRTQWGPHVFHCNDWHTGLLPLYLKTLYSWDQLFDGAKTLLTIHNIGYQGQFGPEVIEDLGLSDSRKFFHQEDLKRGEVNFLKTGLLYADWVNTVSKTYADEIQTEEFGMGMEEILSERLESTSGIVNGVDYGSWNPAVDPLITANYTAADLSGKAACKAALMDRMSLPHDKSAPVLGIVSRLTGQKGFELLPDILPVFLREHDARMCILGSGEQRYEEYFQWLRNTFPEKVAFYRGYHEELAHWIEAGSDLFVMPSRYEPCGLNQMYSLKYGTVPIVRKTGGLADTVMPFDPASGEGNGFVFDQFEVDPLFDQMRDAMRLWPQRTAWNQCVQNGMKADYSWEKQGPEYVDLYRALIG